MGKNRNVLTLMILTLVLATPLKTVGAASHREISIVTDKDSYLPNEEITLELVNTGIRSIEIKSAEIRVIGSDGNLLRVFSMENPRSSLYGVRQTVLSVKWDQTDLWGRKTRETYYMVVAETDTGLRDVKTITVGAKPKPLEVRPPQISGRIVSVDHRGVIPHDVATPLAVTILNTTNEVERYTLTLQTPPGLRFEPHQEELFLEPNRIKKVFFTLTVEEKDFSGKIVILLKRDETLIDYVEREIRVEPGLELLLPTLRVDRSVTLEPGTRTTIVVKTRITNTSKVPAVNIIATTNLPDHLRLVEGSNTWTGSLQPGESVTHSYKVVPNRPGTQTIPPLTITYQDAEQHVLQQTIPEKTIEISVQTEESIRKPSEQMEKPQKREEWIPVHFPSVGVRSKLEWIRTVPGSETLPIVGGLLFLVLLLVVVAHRVSRPMPAPSSTPTPTPVREERLRIFEQIKKDLGGGEGRVVPEAKPQPQPEQAQEPEPIREPVTHVEEEPEPVEVLEPMPVEEEEPEFTVEEIEKMLEEFKEEEEDLDVSGEERAEEEEYKLIKEQIKELRRTMEEEKGGD